MNRTPVVLARGDRRCTSASDRPGQSRGVLRTADRDDAERIREFICGLSPLSQQRRFFTLVSPPNTNLLRAMCAKRSGADILVITDGGGTVLGHGMAVDDSGQGGLAADVGLVIADRWQHRGLGTLLFSTLIGRAAERGVAVLVMDVLPSNDLVLQILHRRWPEAPRQRGLDAITVRAAVSAVPPPAVLALPTTLTLPS